MVSEDVHKTLDVPLDYRQNSQYIEYRPFSFRSIENKASLISMWMTVVNCKLFFSIVRKSYGISSYQTLSLTPVEYVKNWSSFVRLVLVHLTM